MRQSFVLLLLFGITNSRKKFQYKSSMLRFTKQQLPHKQRVVCLMCRCSWFLFLHVLLFLGKFPLFFIAIRCILLLLTLGSSWLLFSSACRFWKSKYIADKLFMKLYNIVQAAKRNKGLFHVQIFGVYQINDPFFRFSTFL